MSGVSEKLKSRAGETLSEVLIALLIAALALTILANMISASSKMVLDSRSSLEKYYQAQGETTTGGTAAVTWGDNSLTFPVSVHANKLGNKDVFSYVCQNGGAGG